mmetsp:Transcript_8004/g.14672  ORF Transcript_8004/g.14672 Transcript_8004/m.14672 type:complete len:563 (+) Transcript_8004:831-2519(+)|eukprot:CAMPEP_0203746696 /NCGR_PEP_ID=MMETSP0098-20131031/2059_1 /ASSEMBLY_ACC=CAM_ASM_000208 /TAXON_ID=96639 /ORGANISM=" , Strain NY0313808BC1" /LENGTH=562 /DNA_ID=CAMNT_0050634885 /DNA_START=822 /DNA_END=2510 /DNA_ORIENTATION=-
MNQYIRSLDSIEVYLVGLCALVSVWFVCFRHHERPSDNKYVASAIWDADERLRLGAVELVQRFKFGNENCIDILDLYIEQLERVNPYLNAVVATRYEQARAEARAADLVYEAFRRGQVPHVPVLLGVPCISKEVFEFPGFPFTAGILSRKHVVGSKTSPVLGRIQDHGAIIIGCGNTSEGCMWPESSNLVHGTSNNPYDLTRTCGGSSGGNASITAALGCCFSITSDVGGSTRIPSLYNGLFGHKPTGGTVPNCRSLPVVRGKIERYCQLGPCTRSSRDLMPLLKIMAGPSTRGELQDASDDELELHRIQKTYMRHLTWPELETVDLKKLRYFVVWDQPGVSLGLISRRHDGMVLAQKKAVHALELEYGVKVETLRIPELSQCFDIWASMIQQEQTQPFAHVISDGKGNAINPFCELFKWLISFGRLSDHTLPALLLAATEVFTKLTPERNKRMIELGNKIEEELNTLLGADGVLIFPGLPNPAPKHGPTIPSLLYFAEFAACGIFNTLQLPVTAVPMGLSKEGLPVGIQLVAGNGHDNIPIAVAVALEDMGFAGWTPPGKA